MEHFDVLIIGAGLSGIGAGAHLRMECPDKSFAILEGREAMGGTWDLFKYPGVRSDSDMYTLGYRFRPWSDPKAIADGPAILEYIRDTSKEFDLDKEIRYGHRVTRAEWSSEAAIWRVSVSGPHVSSPHASKGYGDPGSSVNNGDSAASQAETRRVGSVSEPADGSAETTHFTCSFLYLCTGYYEYESGYTPVWPGFETFQGTIIHPQKWPEDLDYTGKKVLVIGSGATAVTLVPAMAETAEHVTMLQRSPTYVVTMPSQDKIANGLRKLFPSKAAYAMTRWKNVLRQMFFYVLSRKRPSVMKNLIAKGVKAEVGEDYLKKHFRPKYDPWDQRLCVVPDSDLFKSIREGRASIVTGEIETFTETGIRLTNGDELNADIIVTATGLRLKIMAGLTLVVDGEVVKLSKKLAYKGMMYNDVPNLAQAFGYTNASWTLKCDLTSGYVCRLIKYMDAQGFSSCTPRLNDPTVTPEPALDFTSGYVLRALNDIPSQGSKHPWRLHQNYFKDLRMLRHGRLEDGTMEFSLESSAQHFELNFIHASTDDGEVEGMKTDRRLLSKMKELRRASFYEMAQVFFGSRFKYICEGTSMNPTLKDGEVVLVDRDAEIEVGDIVVARHPIEQSSEVVKRVERINERGHYFLVGDNLEDSTDSRHYGAVTREYINGKVVARLV